MSDHISTALMKEFSARTLENRQMVEISRHLASCAGCRQLFHEVVQRRRDFAPVAFDLSPEAWLRADHIAYEQLVPYVENRLDETEREMADVHLKTCAQCREDLRSFRLHRERIEPEMDVRYAPRESVSWREKILPLGNGPQMGWNPVYAAAAAVIIAGAAILTVILSQRHGMPDQQAQQPPSTNINNITPLPSNNGAESPQSTPLLDETARTSNGIPQEASVGGTLQEPAEVSSNSAQLSNRQSPTIANSRITKSPTQPEKGVVSLNDGGRKVILDKSGEITGLGTLSPEIEQSIKEVLLAQHLKRPDELADVIGEKSVLRGTTDKDSFKLLSPQRAVIAEEWPIFRWEPLEGATNYQVHVADSNNHSVVKSEELSATTTRWKPPAPLKRGVVYTWIVSAMVGGEEIISPGVEAPEMKFKVLDEKGVGELNRLNKSSKSHLALGVFYAQVGMVTEAEREFQMVVKENPRSAVALKLLRSVQSWR